MLWSDEIGPLFAIGSIYKNLKIDTHHRGWISVKQKEKRKEKKQQRKNKQTISTLFLKCLS